MITDAQVEAALSKFGGTWTDGPSRMRAALEAAQLAAWQPIESAPRDGTRLLLAVRTDSSEPFICTGRGWSDSKYWDLDSEHSADPVDSGILGWQPLPPSPGAAP